MTPSGGDVGPAVPGARGHGRASDHADGDGDTP